MNASLAGLQRRPWPDGLTRARPVSQVIRLELTEARSTMPMSAPLMEEVPVRTSECLPSSSKRSAILPAISIRWRSCIVLAR